MNRTPTLTTLALITVLTAGLSGCELTNEAAPDGGSSSEDVSSPEDVESIADQDGDGFTVEEGDCNDTDARWQPVNRDRLVERRTVRTSTEAAKQVRETISEYDSAGNVVVEQDAYTYPIVVMGHRIDLEVIEDYHFAYTPTGKLKTQNGDMRLTEGVNGLEAGAIIGQLDREIEYDGNDDMITNRLREWMAGSGVTIKDISEYSEYSEGQLRTHERDWNEPGHFDGYDHEIGVTHYNYDTNGDLTSVNEEQVRKWDQGASSAPTTIDTQYTRDSSGAVLTHSKVVDFFADGNLDSRFDEQHLHTFEYNEYGLPTKESYRLVDHWEDRTNEKLKTYDEESRLTVLEEITEDETLVFSYTYNAAGHLDTERTTFMDGEWEDMVYTYDEAGRVVSVHGATHTGYVYHEATYVYDADGRTLSETVHWDGELYSEIQNTYHADGSLLKRVRTEGGTVVTDTFEMTYACP